MQCVDIEVPSPRDDRGCAVLKHRPREILLSPGLAAQPRPVRLAMARDALNPRGAACSELYGHVEHGLRAVLQTEQDVLLLPPNGTEAMVAAVTNTLSPGEPALVAVNGEFGLRFAAICRDHGVALTVLDVPWGEPVAPERLDDALAARPDVRAVFLVGVESSTGVVSDLQALAAVVRRRAPDSLVVVDAVSHLAAHALEMDAWGLDVVCGAGHKALAGPPGFGLISLSARAWAAAQRATRRGFQTDLVAARTYHAQGQMRFSPPVNALRGLAAALELVAAAGLERHLAHHARVAAYTRRALRALGLAVVAPEACAAHSVTAAWLPAGLGATQVVSALDAQGIVIGTGRGPYTERMIRIGHLGHARICDVAAALAAVGRLLPGGAARPGLACA